MKAHRPLGFPVLVFEVVAPTGYQDDGEIDVLFASDENESSYLVVEVKAFQGSGATARTKRRKGRKFVEEQAIRGARTICSLYGKPCLAAIYTTDNLKTLEVLGSLLPLQTVSTAWRCPRHQELAMWAVKGSICSQKQRCKLNTHCTNKNPCRVGRFVCRIPECDTYQTRERVIIDPYFADLDDARVGAQLPLTQRSAL